MISLLEYINNILESKVSPTSDDALYYKLGRHNANWMPSNGGKKESYGSDPKNATRDQIIKGAKKRLDPFLKDKQEIIHRKDWDLDGLIGETEYQLMHPHYWTLVEWILKNHKRRCDTLTIYECSNKKPYSMQKQRKIMYTDRYSAFTDNACISNPGIIPLEFSHFYPFRYDEWDHFAELPDIAKKYTWVCAARFLTYMKKLGYKHIITVFQTPYPQEWAQWLYDNNIEGAKDWLLIVNTPSFDKMMLKKHAHKFNNNPGLTHQRFPVLPEFRERYEKLLKSTLTDEQKKEFEKLKKIFDEPANKRKEDLKKFNEEHGFYDYDITKGADDEFKMLTPENATTKSKVEKYEKYLQKNVIDKFEDHWIEAEEDDKFHTHRLVFTPLDILMDYNEGKLIDDPDTEYWNMWEACKNLEKSGDYKALNSYCYVWNNLIKEIGIDEVKKYTNKLGLTQFRDKRRVSPDK